MQLTIPFRNDLIELHAVCPTVIVPGETAQLKLQLTALKDIQITEIHWGYPDWLKIGILFYDFPISLKAGETWGYAVSFGSKKDSEGFGELKATLQISPLSSAEPQNVQWTHWLSCFERLKENEHFISDRGRERLVGVVNALPRNGHIFLANFGLFFKEYLHIFIPEHLAEVIAEDIGVSREGLPVDLETFIRIAQGEMNFYGITQLELIAEEYCEESDDRFDSDDLKEVSLPHETEIGL